MSLRTITFWVLYHYGRKEIIAARRFKYEIENMLENMQRPKESAVVRVKGHYLRPAESRGAVKGKE